MRVLAIGYPLPDMAIDNYNALTAPSYSDYDALIIDPASITRTVHTLLEDGGEFGAFDGRPVVNAPSSASAVGAADQLRRRADETRRLLEAGGTVVVMAKPNAVEAGVLGFEGCDRYHWLPAPGGISWGTPYLRAAEGKTVRIVAENHPIASVLRTFRADIGYRATFDDRQTELRSVGRVVAAGGSSVPIAMDFPLLGGRVVFIPAFADDMTTSRSPLATALVDVCRRLNNTVTPEEAPYWVRSVAVPGLEQAEAELEEAQAAATDAGARADAVRARHDELDRHRRLLWEDGAAFAQAVIEAFRLLGFGVTGGYGDPITLTSDGTTAFLEAESSREQVVEWPYIRLQRRLEERLLKSGEQFTGVIVANGFRMTDTTSREEQVATTLRVATENYQYSLLTG
ncbi:MAG: hypothetical protein ACRDG3_07030, partial [Tepidiformaceae bacterium]